jgi:hypothetical protein
MVVVAYRPAVIKRLFDSWCPLSYAGLRPPWSCEERWLGWVARLGGCTVVGGVGEEDDGEEWLRGW